MMLEKYINTLKTVTRKCGKVQLSLSDRNKSNNTDEGTKDQIKFTECLLLFGS